MSKLGYIHSSYGKQYNIAVSNTYSNNILSGSNLPKNSLIIASPYDDRLEEDLGMYSLLATDSEGNAVRLTYCIKEGNGLIYNPETDSLSLAIDEKSIVSENGKLKLDISYFIDNDTIKINNGKLYINTESLRIASKDNFGISKIDGDTIKLDNDTIYVNTTSLDKANNSTEQYGIGKGDENTIITTQGELSVVTSNLRHANGEVSGIVKADELTTFIKDGYLSVNTSNLERGVINKYGIVKGDEETIKVQNEVLSVITENLRKSSESNFGVAKIDGRTIQLNEEGQIYMDSYDELISKIDSYKELKENYDKKIDDIREEIKNSPYEFNRKDIYLFSVNKTSMTELNKPKHMEEVIEMPEQYVIAEFNIITGCDFYISVNYDRFTNEFPPVTLVNINYNDEVEYPNSEGLGINTVYPSTKGEEKKLILTFWAKNYNNSARDRSLITTIDVTVSSIDDIGMKKTERYSVVRYNSNYEIPKKEEKEDELIEKFSISTDINDTYVIDENGNKYSLDDVIPWYINTVSLYVIGKNLKTGEIQKLLNGEKYSLFDYSNKAWQGTLDKTEVYYNPINVNISAPVTINSRLSVISQTITLKKEVFPRNTTEQLTNKNLPIDLYSYNAYFIKIKERIQNVTSLDNFNINNGIIKDKIEDYTRETHLGPNITSEYGGITYVSGIQPKIELSGYYSIPITFTGNTKYSSNPFVIQHEENTAVNSVEVPREAELHDEFLNSYFNKVSTNVLKLNIDSKDTTVEMTYGTNISNIYSYVKAVYSLNGEDDVYINSNIYPIYVPNIHFDINGTYTNNVKLISYVSSPEDSAYLGYNIVSITPSENILLNHIYQNSWNLSYTGIAYYAYYGGLVCDKQNNTSLFTNFNININIVSDPYLTVSNLLINSTSSNIGVARENSQIDIIQTYTINGMNKDNYHITDGEFMLTYKYYIKGNSINTPTLNLLRTEFDSTQASDNPNRYKYIYTITPPLDYYESTTITTDDYYIAYTYYNYLEYSSQLTGWKTDDQLRNEGLQAKNWQKYQILGIDKQLTELSIPRGSVLEAYVINNTIQKPSDTVMAYAYSIITDNIFDENQIYSINTDSNNYIYLLSNINNYYLPNNIQQNLSLNNKISIKVENINNLSNEKSISIDGYLSINETYSNIYNITRSSEDLLEDEVAKYNLKVIDTSTPTLIPAVLVYIYKHPNEFIINNHEINKEITFEYEINTFDSPGKFYLFTQNSNKVYTTFTPLDSYKNEEPAVRRNHIISDYIQENELWKTLKVLSSNERVINATCKKDTTSRLGYTHVNIPYLDELGLWDSLFCTTQVGTHGLEFNTSLLGLKVEKSSTGNKYILSTNRKELEDLIEKAAKRHIGYSLDNTADELLMSSMDLFKKNTFDYTNEDPPFEGESPIYMDEDCSISNAYANQWKLIFKDLSVLLDDQGNIIMPQEPDSNASPEEIEKYNNKLAIIKELEEYFKNTYANDDLLEQFLNQQNPNINDYKFSKYNTDNGQYDIDYFEKDINGGGPEYQFKYYFYDNITGEEEREKIEEINIDPFVCLNNAGYTNYQETILQNLLGDNYSNLTFEQQKEIYPDGFKTFELYYKMLINGYNIFNNSEFKTNSPENYYLQLRSIAGNTIGAIPPTQLLEFGMITGINIGDYVNTLTNFNRAGYISPFTTTIDTIDTLYYSVNNCSASGGPINHLSLALYNNAEELLYPAYYYFTIKDNIYQRNKKFITDFGCSFVVPSGEQTEVYELQYSDGTVYYPKMFYLNIDEQILEIYNSFDLSEGSSANTYTIDELVNQRFANKYNNLNFNHIVPGTANVSAQDTLYYKLLLAQYKYINYPETREWRDAFNSNELDEDTTRKINSIQSAIDNLDSRYAQVQADMSDNISELNASLNSHLATNAWYYYTYDISISHNNNNLNNYISLSFNIRTRNVSSTPVSHTDPTTGETIIDYYNYSPSSINSYFSEALSNIVTAKTTLQNEMNELYSQGVSQLSTQQTNALKKYAELRDDYTSAYNSFIEKLNEYSSVKTINNAELETYYSKLSHEKDIVTSKYNLLKVEYNNLLRAYLKEQIFTIYKKSKDYSNNVSFTNMTNQSILKVMQGWQNRTIELYVKGALKEIDYVLSILSTDLYNIKNVDIRIIDPTTVNTSPLNSLGGETNILNLADLYPTNFDIFNNIIPRYKLVNKYNIMYLDNFREDNNNDYFIKYSIDNNPKTIQNLSQDEINSHQIFFGTMKYNTFIGNQYIHLFEYYRNYFVKEIITPFSLLDIYSIANGFVLEYNTNNNGKYYKVHYNDDSVPESVIVTGYPEILYRKNQVDPAYDLSSILYTKTNNISIENNLTMLSLQKDYFLYDNQSVAQYVCSNRDYFVVNPNYLNDIPYYGNMMFTSLDNISRNNLKYIFDTFDSSVNYKIIDYNLYFASSKFSRSQVDLNSNENHDGKIGRKDFEDDIKIFTFIKDYYNENGTIDGVPSTYTNNLIWKYCKDKTNSNLSYFKILNYEFINPNTSESNNNEP